MTPNRLQDNLNRERDQNAPASMTDGVDALDYMAQWDTWPKANTRRHCREKPQGGGAHYAKHAIQPIEYIEANGLGFHTGNVVKYVTRWEDKGGAEDLRKARWYLDRMIELHGGEE